MGLGNNSKAVQFNLFGLPEKESTFTSDDLADLDEFVALTKKHKGLLLQAVVPKLLGVSRQRFHSMQEQYKFKSWTLFGKEWFSRTEIESFSKVNRNSGRGRASLAEIFRTTKDELL